MGSVEADIAELLDELRKQGWRVGRRKRYWVCYCACPDKHMKTVHLSPSDPRYLKNLKGQLKRATCWKEG